MCVYIFGNGPSPAIAIYGLRREVREEDDSNVRRFSECELYADRLKYFPTEEEAISALKEAQEMLAVLNLRLHKVVSNTSSHTFLQP